jgi:hypothetical protein
MALIKSVEFLEMLLAGLHYSSSHSNIHDLLEKGIHERKKFINGEYDKLVDDLSDKEYMLYRQIYEIAAHSIYSESSGSFI